MLSLSWLCKQLICECTQRALAGGPPILAGWNPGCLRMIQSRDRVPPALQHCRLLLTCSTHTQQPPCTLPGCSGEGNGVHLSKGNVLFLQGVRAGGELGSSACGSWLWLLQDAVTPLLVLPGLLSFLGTFLHLQIQLCLGRTTSW